MKIITSFYKPSIIYLLHFVKNNSTPWLSLGCVWSVSTFRSFENCGFIQRVLGSARVRLWGQRRHDAVGSYGVSWVLHMWDYDSAGHATVTQQLLIPPGFWQSWCVLLCTVVSYVQTMWNDYSAQNRALPRICHMPWSPCLGSHSPALPPSCYLVTQEWYRHGSCTD